MTITTIMCLGTLIWVLVMWFVGYSASRGKSHDSMDPIFAMAPIALLGPIVIALVVVWWAH